MNVNKRECLLKTVNIRKCMLYNGSKCLSNK